MIGFVRDEKLGRSECIIIDAANFEAGPVARVVMPQPVALAEVAQAARAVVRVVPTAGLIQAAAAQVGKVMMAVT